LSWTRERRVDGKTALLRFVLAKEYAVVANGCPIISKYKSVLIPEVQNYRAYPFGRYLISFLQTKK